MVHAGSERSRSTEDSINMAGENEVDGQGEGVSEISKPRMSQGHKRSHSDSSAAIRRIDPNILRYACTRIRPTRLYSNIVISWSRFGLHLY